MILLSSCATLWGYTSVAIFFGYTDLCYCFALWSSLSIQFFRWRRSIVVSFSLMSAVDDDILDGIVAESKIVFEIFLWRKRKLFKEKMKENNIFFSFEIIFSVFFSLLSAWENRILSSLVKKNEIKRKLFCFPIVLGVWWLFFLFTNDFSRENGNEKWNVQSISTEIDKNVMKLLEISIDCEYLCIFYFCWVVDFVLGMSFKIKAIYSLSLDLLTIISFIKIRSHWII